MSSSVVVHCNPAVFWQLLPWRKWVQLKHILEKKVAPELLFKKCERVKRVIACPFSLSSSWPARAVPSGWQIVSWDHCWAAQNGRWFVIPASPCCTGCECAAMVLAEECWLWSNCADFMKGIPLVHMNNQNKAEPLTQKFCIFRLLSCWGLNDKWKNLETR